MEKYSVSIRIVVGATWYGVTRSSFFLKVNDDRLFGHENWGFQQDGASSHTHGRVQKCREQNFKFFIPKNRWPPSSLESNSLDYSIGNNI